MKSLLRFILVFYVFLCTKTIMSQNETGTFHDPTVKDSSYLSLDVNFINDAVFMGRRDSISAPYLYPSITYYNKSGFYATGSFSYLTKSDQGRIDLFLVTAGYNFTVKKFEGDISATKYFFNDDSYNIISEVEADVTATFNYDFEVLNLGLSSSLYFNNNSSSDFFLSSEVSHDFVSKNQKFQISPTAGVHFGSQNFYEEYYINNRFGNGSRGQGQGQGSGDPTQTTMISIEEDEKFNLLAIELSLPLWYVHKQFTLSFLPMFVVPQSEATIIADDTVVEENLDETFYWIVGLSYKF